ncbi:MAG: hypothetical protein IME98_03750 [Proteobacteria bacterium]|nr:hypothetical protein [Pseudomonadota bacterium]
MFIGNGGGVQLAYDDGEFKVPGRSGKPKRIRFPADALDSAPKLADETAAVEVEDKESLADVVEEIESMDRGTIESPSLNKNTNKKRAQDFDEDLF